MKQITQFFLGGESLTLISGLFNMRPKKSYFPDY